MSKRNKWELDVPKISFGGSGEHQLEPARSLAHPRVAEASPNVLDQDSSLPATGQMERQGVSRVAHSSD